MSKPAKNWCCDMLETRHLRHLSYTLPEDDAPSRLSFCERFKAGEALDPAEMPERIFWVNEYPNKLPDVFIITDGVVIVSERLKTLWSGFNLGRSRCFEVPLYARDQTTQIEGARYFVFNYAESAPVGVPEQMPYAKKIGRHWSIGQLKNYKKIPSTPPPWAR